MERTPFINFFEQITNLHAGLINELNQAFSAERYRSKQIILGEGQTENRLWYLNRGLARSYVYDKDGQQHTLHFWKPEEVIFSYAGFLKEPSREYIELLAESELYSCTYVKLEQLMRDYPEASRIVGVINRRHLEKDYKKSLLHSLKTKDRYKLFRTENPEIFTYVPLWIIASYLHMTRENLSRIISGE